MPKPSSNGTVQGAQDDAGPGLPAPEDERALADRDRTLADADQTGADADQTLSDADQTGADADQTASDRDQAAADSDQAASDLAPGAADVHDATRDMRDRSAAERRRSSEGRLHAAAERDAVASARDAAAAGRDQAAALRDRQLAARDAAWQEPRSLRGAELLLRAADDRRRAAVDRAAAAEGRSRAAADREQAAHDREQAARDRAQAQADRAALLEQLAIAEIDALTRAQTRAAGLAGLDREIDRARRAKGDLVVAYVDVVGLKAVNDEHGHAAGDAVLQRAVGAIRSQLRSYDSIVRIGGDEFLCVMSGATVEAGRGRFRTVDMALAAGSQPCGITAGFAALTGPADTAAELIARADADLMKSRRL